MARVSYFDETKHPEQATLVEKLRAGRRGSLINVYKLLLHSPPLAASWYEHVSAARWGTKLSGRLREIVIIRVGKINDIPYVMKQHVPGLAEAAQKVGGLNTGWFGYDNQTESLRGLFTTLKQNPDAFEKLLTSPIPTPNAPRPPVDQLKGLLDFSLLPPFDAVAKYFSFTVNAVASTPEGIAFKSFLPAPGGKK